MQRSRTIGQITCLVCTLFLALSSPALASFNFYKKCTEDAQALDDTGVGFYIIKVACGEFICDHYVYFELDNPDHEWIPGIICGIVPDPDSTDGDGDIVTAPPPPEGGPQCKGSNIDVFAQSVGERIPIAGTPFFLTYDSSRGRRDFEYQTEMGACAVAIAGNSLPDCRLEISHPFATSALLSQDYVGAPGQRLFYRWDSLNTDSSRIYFAKVLKFTYTFLSGILAGTEYSKTALVGTFDSRFYGLGGWQIDVLHAFDSQTLYMGDGSSRYARAAQIGGFWVRPPSSPEWYVFDRNGRHLKTVTNLLGAPVYKFGYNSAGHLTSITDANGLVTRIQRNASGNPTAIIAPFGQVTQLTLNAAGFLSAVTDSAGNVTRMSYRDSNGLLASFQPPGVAATQFTYDSRGLLVRDQNPTGRFLSFSRQIDPGGQTTVNAASGLGVRMTMSGSFGPGEQATQITTATGENISSNSSYSGLLTTKIDGRGTHTTALLFDNRLSWFGFEGRKIFSTQDTSPGGTVDRLVEYTENYGLNDVANIFSIKLADFSTKLNGLKTAVLFDGATKTYTITSPVGRKATVTIDALERPVRSQMGGLAANTFTYDGLGRLSQMSQGSRSSQFQYDAQGNLSQIVAPLGRTTRYDYDPVGRVTSITLPDSRVIGLRYNARGLLTGVKPPGRPTTQQAYNAFDNRTQFIPPAVANVPAPETSYTYDLDQRLSQVVRPSRTTIDFGYDATKGTLASITTAQGTNTLSTDVLGQVTASDFGGVNLAFDYEGPFETAQSIDWGGVSAQVQRTYGALGLITQHSVVTGASASTVGYSYDNDQLLTQVGKLALTRNAAGLVTADVLNGITSAYTYNAFGEMTGQAASFGGSVLFSQALNRNAVGQITKVVEQAGTASTTRIYGYDAVGRLDAVSENGTTVASYTYDANSNRIGGFTRAGSINASYDAQDRIKTYGSLTFAHDADGERTRRQDAATGSVISYSYDAFGNLAQVKTPGPDVSYTLDGLGRRVARIVDGAVRSRFVYDDQFRIVAELNASGTLVRRFVYGPEDSVPQYIIKSGRLYRYLIDANGSIRMVVDSSTGQIAQQITYDEFGRVLADTSPGFQPFGFAGGLTDPVSGLVHFGYRDYDPETGRWLSQDPIQFRGGDTNLYGYVLQDPVNLLDPNGKNPVLMGMAIGALLGTLLTPTPIDTPITPVGEGTRVLGGATFGAAVGGVCTMAATGYELTIAGLRFAPFGNRTGNPTGQLPHYHRRSIDPRTGGTIPGQGIGRHRPWDTRSTDKSVIDRF